MFNYKRIPRMISDPFDKKGGQAKMSKSEILGWKSSILHLAPHRSAFLFWEAYKAGDATALRELSKSRILREAVDYCEVLEAGGIDVGAILRGFNTCKGASAECIRLCLNKAGRGIFADVSGARIARTILLAVCPDAFWSRLWFDLLWLSGRCKREGKAWTFRFNGTSDINVPDVGAVVISLGGVPIDYTKRAAIVSGTLPGASVTYSFKGGSASLRSARKILAEGGNVAVVFSGELPETWEGFPVIDGDESDLRNLDPPGTVVGLRIKGHSPEYTVGGFVQKGMEV